MSQARSCLDAIRSKNARLNAFVHVSDISTAISNHESRRLSNSLRSPIDGLPIAIKDIFTTTSSPTTCASQTLRNYVSPFSTTVVSLLENAGCILLGKTNMDEFGMGSANVCSVHGVVTNPGYSERRVSGGSSGGSAAAVAGDMCHAYIPTSIVIESDRNGRALASDTGGSTRLPASYCSIVGFKPSYGMVSRYGMVSYASSLDTVGIMAKKVEVVRKLFDEIAKHDDHDETMVSQEVREVCEKLDTFNVAKNGKIRVGVPKECVVKETCENGELIDMMTGAIERMERIGVEVVPISLPLLQHALPVYYIIASAEASSNLSRYDGLKYGHQEPLDDYETFQSPGDLFAKTRSVIFGQEVQRRIMLGNYVLSQSAYKGYFQKAQQIRRMILNEICGAFSDPNPLSPTLPRQENSVDFILTPTAVSKAPLVEEKLKETDVLKEYVNDVYTVPANLAGIPAISLPSHIEGLGIQLMGQYGHDRRLLDMSKHIETVLCQ